MSKLFSSARNLAVALVAILAIMPWRASAQQAPQVPLQLGLIGAAKSTPVQIAEMHVTYRFDQMGNGKSVASVPVQMTYRLHNPSETQDLEIQMPSAGPEGQTPEITAVFINGQEQPLPEVADKSFIGADQAIPAATITATLPKDSDLIVDIRALQPITGENLLFAFRTGRAWSGNVQTGTLEAFFPFTTANWNVVLRKDKPEPELIPLTYSGKLASWNFTDLDLAKADDVFWQMADLQAMSYYEQGLTRWQKNNNDPEAYAMLHRALLDMIPCQGLTMPLSSWWNNIYETITVGTISTITTENEGQWIKALELWSANWNVPQGEDADCTALQQRPDRYRIALQSLMNMPKDQRSSAVQRALDKHYNFLRKWVALKGENSLKDNPNDIPSTDPYGDNKLSDKDKQLLAQWDSRFSNPQAVANQTSTTGTARALGEGTVAKVGTAVSSTVNSILQKLPKLSFGTQIIFFGILALLVLIVMGYIIFKWQETPTMPQRPTDTSNKTPTVPLMGMGLGTKINLANAPPTTNEPEKVGPAPSAHETIGPAPAPWQKPDKEADLIRPPEPITPKPPMQVPPPSPLPPKPPTVPPTPQPKTQNTPPTPSVPMMSKPVIQTPPTPIPQTPKPWEPPRNNPPDKTQQPKPPLSI